MRAALRDAGIQPEEVGYVNAHATSTPAGDGNESRAIELVFGEHAVSRKLKVSGTKSMTGHLLGGAGGLEAGITVLALQNQILPPTINLENVDPECILDYVPNKPVAHTFDVALSNSFGFGGINATLIMRRWTE
jgi:3-oxoacyl-[acyl-carrier-protein] synthase II